MLRHCEDGSGVEKDSAAVTADGSNWVVLAPTFEAADWVSFSLKAIREYRAKRQGCLVPEKEKPDEEGWEARPGVRLERVRTKVSRRACR